MIQKSQKHTICPPKSILHFVFAAKTWNSKSSGVILFKHQPLKTTLLISTCHIPTTIVAINPALGHACCKSKSFCDTRVFKCIYSKEFKRRPGIWKVPLFASAQH